MSSNTRKNPLCLSKDEFCLVLCGLNKLRLEYACGGMWDEVHAILHLRDKLDKAARAQEKVN